MCEALKFHLLPYLFEIGLSGLDACLNDQHSARLHFQACFLELIQNLASTDAMLRQENRGLVSHFAEKVVSSALVDYLIDLTTLLKNKDEIRHKI
jgi:hypothetical protein